MPSVGRIKQLSVIALAGAIVGITASSASAADPVTLWACHGPQGVALTDVGRYVVPNNADAACAQDDPAYNTFADGLRTSLSGTGQPSSWRFDVPPKLTLKQVRIFRQTSQLGTGQSYLLKTSSVPVLESRASGDTPLNGPAEFAPTAPATDLGDWVQFGLSCATGCQQPASGTASAELSAIALTVSDETLPNFAVGGVSSPAVGRLSLDIQATDTGSGLRWASAQIGSAFVQGNFAGGDDCRDLTPGTPTVDMPLSDDCAEVSSVPLGLDTINVPDGNYNLVVKVADWAGNVREITQPITVLNTRPINTPTQTLSIGTSGITTQGGAQSAGSGGVAGASAQQCRSPRLSVFLAQKPLRVSRGTPVLKRGKRYRFSGRLTCVVNNRRRSAPKRTRIDILNTIGRKTIEKAGTTIKNKGGLSVILAYKSSRLITFRFTNSDGQRSQVRIRVRVARR
jgi:hypothetical protein